ncbi:MAG: hypothetical protein LUC50_09665 [Ruminococcus sp.]|nr:hypothetical protein [Ruminococcus sp.]
MHSIDLRQGCAKIEGKSEESYHDLLAADLVLLQTRFSEELQIQPIVFAYPYGFVSEESKPVLLEADFQITLTSLEQPNFITRDPSCLYGLGKYNRPGGVDTETYMAYALAASS